MDLSNKLKKIIPKQIIKIERIIKLSSTKPKNKIEIIVAILNTTPRKIKENVIQIVKNKIFCLNNKLTTYEDLK